MDTGADLAQPDGGLGDGGTGGARKPRPRNGRDHRDGPVGDSGEVPVPEASSDLGMAVANIPKRAEKWQPGDSVWLRLARAQDDVKTITQDATIKVKTKDEKEFSYKGVSSAQVVTFAKRALLDNGLVFVPMPDQDGVKISGNKTALWVLGHFISVDAPHDRHITGAWGAGTDNNDKDYAKAITNAVKIILSKTLMMSTLEDETDDATPHDAEVKPRQVKNAEALTDVAIRSWADAYKVALDGCSSLKQLKEVRAQNAPMMNNPGLPAVTKDYFLDKITALEGTLE